jgi:hypothetical protein
MSSLSQAIFAVNDIASETVEVPQWGVTVLVKSMTALDRAKMIGNAVESADGQLNLQEVLPDMVILCTFDPETGERVFLDSDRDALMAKSAGAIEIIATVAMRLSGLTETAVDELGKGSSSTKTDASSLS